MSDIGPKPKPGSGTSPQPSRPNPKPRPRYGHLPIGAPSYPMPRLGEVIRDAENKLRQAISDLARPFTAESAPSAEDDPAGLSYVEIRIMTARADIHSALRNLGEITDLDLPPAGSAVRIPGPPLTAALDEGGGPPSHRGTTGDGPTPGHTDVACAASCESPGGPPSPGAGGSFSLPVPPDWHWLNTK